MSTPRAGTPVTRPPEQEPPASDREQQPLSSPQKQRPIAAQSSPKPPVLDHLPASVEKEDRTKAKDGDRQGNEDYDSVFQTSSLDTTTKPRNRRNRHQVPIERYMVPGSRYSVSSSLLPVFLSVNLGKSPSTVSIIKCGF
jgi:hypothetical protein